MERPLINATVIQAHEQPPATWRGGTTRAIYAFPAETLGNLAAAQLWVGTATIERDGPYSVFANRTRIHLPLRGNGLQLHFQNPAETLLLPTLAQAIFAGDRPLDVTLVDGPVAAFNLIFHPSVQATVDVHQLTAELGHVSMPRTHFPAADDGKLVQILYAVDGFCTVAWSGGEPLVLAVGDALVGAGRADIQLHRCDNDVAVVHATCLMR